jgi:UDP-N-acetyl-D-glucosamine/UDP-N-acetyl-D-galactosamine dehydrogenase
MVSNQKLKDAVICVVGLGYVGMPLAQAFSKSHPVIGFDLNVKKVKELKQTNLLQNLSLTSQPEDIKKADFFLICVPTPVTRSKQVDLSFVENAAGTVGRNMKKGCVVILESTVYPGVTEDIVKPILEKESGMKCCSEFKLGYSPERINPGDDIHSVEKITKIVSGIDTETTDLVAALYSGTVQSVFKAKNIRTAEAAKVIENIQRDLNIALVNEFAIIFEKMGLNTRDVLKAAETKWNFHRYYPGLVGGYCIPVNPYYLVHKAEELGYHPQVILAGRSLNDLVPLRVAGMMVDALNWAGKAASRSTVLILGLTYKEEVPDIRESAAKQLVKELKANGVRVLGFDPAVDKENFENNWENEFGLEMLWDWDDVKNEKVDGIILTVAHSFFRKVSLSDLKKIQGKSPILIDIPVLYDAEEAKQQGFNYRTL